MVGILKLNSYPNGFNPMSADNKTVSLYRVYPLTVLSLLSKGDIMEIEGQRCGVKQRVTRLDNEQYPLLIEASTKGSIENTEEWLNKEPSEEDVVSSYPIGKKITWRRRFEGLTVETIGTCVNVSYEDGFVFVLQHAHGDYMRAPAGECFIL